MPSEVPPILVTGSTGKLGRVLRAVWPDMLSGKAKPLWQVRSGEGDVQWQIGAELYAGPCLNRGAVLHLAGGRVDRETTIALALAVCEAAAAQGARHVFLASSSAVFGPDELLDLSEDTEPAPSNPYGQAKLQMERDVMAWFAKAGPTAPNITLLRIGNVLGSDSLIGGLVQGRPVRLDPVPGRKGGPIRSYIGPRSFADVLAQLCLQALKGGALPRILNVGAAPAVSMAALLDAAGADWDYGPENPNVMPRLVLAVDRLMGLVTLPTNAADPFAMVAEWRNLAAQPA
jgi:nucleoside-diphosphate-sugar epimerase